MSFFQPNLYKVGVTFQGSCVKNGFLSQYSSKRKKILVRRKYISTALIYRRRSRDQSVK